MYLLFIYINAFKVVTYIVAITIKRLLATIDSTSRIGCPILTIYNRYILKYDLRN